MRTSSSRALAVSSASRYQSRSLGAHRQREPDDPVREVALPIGRGLVAQLVQAGLDLRVRLRPGAVDHWPVDIAEADVPGQVADIGVAPLGRADQPGEHGEPVVGDRVRQQVVAAAPPVQDGDHDGGGGGHPVHRPGDPQQCLFEFRCAGQRLDAVAGEHGSQLPQEMTGHPAALRVEERQVGEQVLVRAPWVLFLLLVFWDRPGQRRRVGEDLQEFLVTAHPAVIVGRNVCQSPASLPAELTSVAVFDVVAEQVGPEQIVDVGYVMARGRCRQAGELGRRSACAPDPFCPLGAVCPAGRSQRDQRRPRLHLRIHLGVDRADGAIVRCGDGGFHLHAFDDGERVTGPDDVAGARRTRRRRTPGDGTADLPAVVAGDDVRDAVDLDQQPGTPARGDDLVPPAAAGDRPLEAAEPLDADLDQGRGSSVRGRARPRRGSRSAPGGTRASGRSRRAPAVAAGARPGRGVRDGRVPPRPRSWPAPRPGPRRRASTAAASSAIGSSAGRWPPASVSRSSQRVS